MTGPLNYSTTIDPTKSAAECIARLAAHGATAIGMTYEVGFPNGLQFQIQTPQGLMAYALPVNVAGTHKALQKAARERRIPQSKATLDQAKRTGWRVIKDWLEAQLALIEAGVADMSEVMLPWMLVDGQTVYQAFLENHLERQLQLESGQ